MNKSKNILDFYIKCNDRKYNIVKEKEKRNISEAEKVILECILAYGLCSEYDLEFDLNKVIKMLFAKSFEKDVMLLTKKEYYLDLIEEYDKNLTLESEVARMVREYAINIDGIEFDREEVPKLYQKYENLRNIELNDQERPESVLEHIYGTCLLAIGLDSEFSYYVDFDTVINKVIINNLTKFDEKAFDNLYMQAYFKSFTNNTRSIEHSYATLCDQLEYSLQVKMNEIRGYEQDKNVFEEQYNKERDCFTSFPCLKRILEEIKTI